MLKIIYLDNWTIWVFLVTLSLFACRPDVAEVQGHMALFRSEDVNVYCLNWTVSLVCLRGNTVYLFVW